MATKKEQILDLIRQQPGIRNVEIADALDYEEGLIRSAIQKEIETGMVLIEKVIAPNGAKINSYRINPTPEKDEVLPVRQTWTPAPTSVTKQTGVDIDAATPRRGKGRKAPNPANHLRHLPQTGVQSSLAIGDLRIILWNSGNLVVSANDNTVDLRPEQAKALRAFVELM